MDINKIIQRVKGIIISPTNEWELIVLENDSRSKPIKEYAIPLILLVSIFSLVGNFIAPKFISASFSYALTNAFLLFIITILTIYISSYTISALAAQFGTQKNIEKVFKLVIYALTPSFLASILSILHESFNLLSLYSIYLLWLGIDQLLKTPKEHRLTYTIVCFLILSGIYTILTVLVGIISLSSIFL